MSLILKNVKVTDQGSKHHGTVVDITIQSGTIESITKPKKQSVKVHDFESCLVTPGLFDIRSHFNDPGLEHKESIETGIAAAKSGGFTDVCILPNTTPCIDSKGQVDYIKSKSKKSIVKIRPYGAVSKEAKGETLSEMLDLHKSGVVGFTDGHHSINNAELLLKALQYANPFGGIIVNQPQDHSLSAHGQMHEGEVSTELGMRGISSLAEQVMLDRDISILRYTGGRLHITGVSSAESVSKIEKAKKEGLQITCDVHLSNLVWTDQQLRDFDSNYKVSPPLRTEHDRKALIDGLKKGIIDAITTAHTPQDHESKNLEFDLAEFGMIGLQTAFSSLLSIKSTLDLELSLMKLGNGARQTMNIAPVNIEVGQPACLAIFDPNKKWIFNARTNKSKSINSPLFGQELTGRCVGLINGEKSYFLTK